MRDHYRSGREVGTMPLGREHTKSEAINMSAPGRSTSLGIDFSEVDGPLDALDIGGVKYFTTGRVGGSYTGEEGGKEIDKKKKNLMLAKGIL
jgi:hypothetical protein